MLRLLKKGERGQREIKKTGVLSWAGFGTAWLVKGI
jgi:hypothetical protein